MSKVDEIKNQLARRLEQQPARTPAAAAETAGQTQPDAPASQSAAPRSVPGKGGGRKPATGPAPEREGVIKLSASLYSFDIECLDRIREFMRGKGVRNITDSEALRLACRAVRIDDAFMGIYEEMIKEDRRRRR